tara:strand:+ start:498 stop:689 length:192 start_codon:yes stop_codon:yes gene_type:complete
MTYKILKNSTLLFLFSILISNTIKADEAIETNNQSSLNNSFSIEEIIVTAEKRSESYKMSLNQ